MECKSLIGVDLGNLDLGCAGADVEEDALRWLLGCTGLILFKEFVVGIKKFGFCMNGLGFDSGVFFIEFTLEFACMDLALAAMSFPLTSEFRSFNLRILLVISLTTGVVYGIVCDGLDLFIDSDES